MNGTIAALTKQPQGYKKKNSYKRHESELQKIERGGRLRCDYNYENIGGKCFENCMDGYTAADRRRCREN